MTVNTILDQNIAKARKVRDDSLAKVQPPLPELPNPLPINVTGIPKQVLTSEEYSITELDPLVLAKKISSKELSSVVVVKAYLRRGALAQLLVNCVTELLWDDAIASAEKLDEILETTGKTVGPLHGIPLSVKEHVHMKGKLCNTGFAKYVDYEATEDNLLLNILTSNGCIPFVRTTQPQSLMHLETETVLMGTTVNPFNRNLTCGGSSGGEGALIGIHGSPLGLGTDIGGSIRAPAANNGIYGLRPSSHRVPASFWFHVLHGNFESVVPVIGPMTRSIEMIDLFMKVVIGSKPHLLDFRTIPLPWIENPFPTNEIKIGVMTCDGVVMPHPPVIRAIKEAASALKTKASGFGYSVEVVDFEPYKQDKAWEIICSLYFPNGAKDIKETMNQVGEPQCDLTKWILTQAGKKELSIEEYWHQITERDEYKAEYLNHWNQSGIDVLLCPVGPGCAPPIKNAKYWGYTAQWNLCDYPSLVMPITTVNPTLDQPIKDYKPLNDDDDFNYKLYTGPERYKDAPVSIQIVAQRNQDEKTIAVSRLLNKCL